MTEADKLNAALSIGRASRDGSGAAPALDRFNRVCPGHHAAAFAFGKSQNERTAAGILKAVYGRAADPKEIAWFLNAI